MTQYHIQDQAKRHGRKRQCQHMRVHVRQHKAKRREFIDWLAGRRTGQITVTYYPRRTEPPPEVPFLHTAGHRRARFVPLSHIPEGEIPRRSRATLVRDLNQNGVEIAQQQDKDEPQHGKENSRSARRGFHSALAPVAQKTRPQQVVQHAKYARAGQREQSRDHQVERHPAGHAHQIPQRGGDHIAKIVVADRVATHPGIIGREGRAVLDGARKCDFHRLFRTSQAGIQGPNHNPQQEQAEYQRFHQQHVLPVGSDPLPHGLPIKQGQTDRQHNQRRDQHTAVGVGQQTQAAAQPEHISDKNQPHRPDQRIAPIRQSAQQAEGQRPDNHTRRRHQQPPGQHQAAFSPNPIYDHIYHLVLTLFTGFKRAGQHILRAHLIHAGIAIFKYQFKLSIVHHPLEFS
jgi:hypothetical protein